LSFKTCNFVISNVRFHFWSSKSLSVNAALSLIAACYQRFIYFYFSWHQPILSKGEVAEKLRKCSSSRVASEDLDPRSKFKDEVADTNLS